MINGAVQAGLQACAVAVCAQVEVAEGGAGSKICNWSQSFSSGHSGEIQFLTLHFACQGATGLQGAASGWAAGPGAWAMPEGPQDGTQPLLLALQGWITLTLQRFVCSH